MRAARNSVMSRVVALAWSMGQVCNPDIRALLGCGSAQAGTALCNAQRGGYLVVAAHTRPKQFVLAPQRAEAIASMPNQQDLRTQAEQLAQVVRRVRKAHEAGRLAGRARRHAALASGAVARAERRAAAAAARAATAKQARAAARIQAKTARALHTPSGAQRPPMLPGSSLLVAEPSATPGVITKMGTHQIHRHAPVQDPKGLLVRPPEPPAPPAPACPAGGVLRPHGPYIRPDGLAHLAAPSRRGDVLVAHRPPLSHL